MKFLNRVASITACVAMLLTACSSIDQNEFDSADYGYRRKILESRNEIVSSGVVVDDSFIYQTLGSGKTSYYILDVPTGKTNELGFISDFVMDTNARALFNNVLYFYVTVQDGNSELCNVLYSLDLGKTELAKVSEDHLSAPLLSLYSAPQGVLALKIRNGSAYFELVASEVGSCEKMMIEPDQGETFVIADVFDDCLFVFTYKNSPDQTDDFDYYLKCYSLDTYTVKRVIKLESIKPYIQESRIGTMELLGDYIYFENYSNLGLVCKISNNDVTKILEEENLVLSNNLEEDTDNYQVFYIRRSNDIRLLDLSSGRMDSITLPLPDDERIQVIFSNQESVIVKAKKYTDSKEAKNVESVYLFTYSDFLKRLLSPSAEYSS